MSTRPATQMSKLEDGNPRPNLISQVGASAIPAQNFLVGLSPWLANETIPGTCSGKNLLNAADQLSIRARYQASIITLGQQALTTTDLSSLLSAAAALVTQTLGLDSCSIWRVLSDNLSLQQVANTGKSLELSQTALISGQTQTWVKHLLQHNPVSLSPNQIRELHSSDRPLTGDWSESRLPLSGLSIQIPGQVQPLGLVIAYVPEACPLTEDDTQFLQAIAQILAAAIERKRTEELLYTQTQVLEHVTSGVPLQKVFETLCLLLEQQHPGGLCSVLLVDRDSGRLRSGVAPSLPQEYAQGIEGLLIGDRSGSCGAAAYREETVFVTDIVSEPLWEKFRDLALEHDIRACWSTPFFSQAGEVLGTFALSHRVACEPTPYHLQILKTAAHLASIATERHHAAEQLRQQALYDDLTGLPNRVFFMEKLAQKLQAESEHQNPSRRAAEFAILFLDVDHFKLVNDSLGHSVGDQLLLAIVHLVKRCIRPTDVFARLGGDEFAILINQAEAVAAAQIVAERIRAVLSFPLKLQEHEVFTSVSVGIAHSIGNYKRPEEILRDADTAMYRAKALGRSRYVIFDQEMHTHALARLRMEIDLRHAVENLISNGTWQFQLYYQPIISLITGKISGFEALLRWFHPERGMISPIEFIPIAEETGLILPIGRWVLQTACSQLHHWQENLDLPNLTISVNVSGRQFLQPDFIPQIKQILASSQIPANCLKLEITESVLMETAISVTERLEELRDLGIHLSLDDFGTGYSSLSYLHRFPVNTLKVDRSFVQGFSNGQAQIVKAIVTLAHSLTMDVVAEGIETAEQLAQLKQLDCEYGQGYLFSPPVNQEKAEALLLMPPGFST
ncbi:MAG TPA: EAL domain-containing protein [Coleofasciculaceae cyanobacterium]